MPALCDGSLRIGLPVPEPATLGIAAVLRHYGATSIPEGSGWHTMRCPFHGDSHASGRVNVELGGFKCNACPVRGDAIKLIELQEKMSYGDACEFARSVLGQSVEGISRSAPKPAKRRALGREKWKAILD